MNNRVVITGIGAVSPLGLDWKTSWQGLVEGKSGAGLITSFDTNGFQTRIAAEVKGFDASNCIGRKEAKRMDRFSQLAVCAALEALQQSKLHIDSSNSDRTAVLIGSAIGGIITLSEQLEVLKTKGPSKVTPFFFPMMLTDTASVHVSLAIGAKGPNLAAVSACSSGADAVGQALQLVRSGIVDIAIAGGAEAAICPVCIAAFNSINALSVRNEEPEKASRPFDANRDGFLIGEGAAILVIESAKSALKRGVEPIVELTGYASTSDAFHVTQPAPDGEGGARAMRLAMDDAGLIPYEIGYINAHGTSTPMNDKYETQAVKSAFGECAYKIPISSTKSMTGHLLGASGAIEAAICAYAIKEGILPPTINLETPDPDCNLDYIPNRARDIKLKAAMSNSLGFGGHNVSLIFKEWDSHD